MGFLQGLFVQAAPVGLLRGATKVVRGFNCMLSSSVFSDSCSYRWLAVSVSYNTLCVLLLGVREKHNTIL